MKLMKKLIALAMVAATVLAIAVPAMATYSTMYVNVGAGQTVRLRATASSTGDVLINIPHGTPVQAEYYNSTWHKVKYSGYTGYMMSEFLSSYNPGGHPQNVTEAFGSTNLVQSSTKKYTVKNLQKCLIQEGLLAVGTDDGIFGNNTFSAVKAYQTRYSLSSDGIVGPATKSDLWISYGTYLKNNGVLGI